MSLILQSARGTDCFINDHKNLLKIWTEDVFRRATDAVTRRYAGEFS